MLSIGIIKSSRAAASYYEKDDYYLPSQDTAAGHLHNGEEGALGTLGASTLGGAGASSKADNEETRPTLPTVIAGEWWGKGAEALGLEGPVQKTDFTAMLEGHLPDGTVLGTTQDGKKLHTPGWDLTFSAPKSVSIAFEIGGDERLLEAHTAAVKDALHWLEDNSAGHRERSFIGRLHVATKKLTVALFQHDTSRNQDPELHTHAVVTNVTQRNDDRFVSLNSKPLFDAKMAAGAIYRASLAERVQEHGYEIERTKRDGTFELSSVPTSLIKAMSSRSAEIREAMEKRGLHGAENAARAALMTRQKKEIVGREALVPLWREQALEMGVNVENIVADARSRGDLRGNMTRANERIVKESIKTLSEREAAFSHEKLTQLAVQTGVGHVTLNAIYDAIGQSTRDGRIQPNEIAGRRMWVTPAAAQRENIILELLAAGRDAVGPVADERTIDGALDASILKNSTSQRAAAKLILHSRDRHIGIVGRAGTGKTTLLSAVNEIASDAGYRLKGMSQNSDAARVLQKETGIESSTLQKHLIEAGQDLSKLLQGNFIERRQMTDKYKNEIWVIDEASQVGSKSMRQTLHYAERLGVRVALIFDPKQLAAIDQGKPAIQMLNAGLPHVELTEIRRQRLDRHRDAVTEIYQGAPEAALHLLSSEVKKIEDREARLSAMIDEYKIRSPDSRAETLLATATNREKTFLNEGVRNVLRDEGRLPHEHSRTVLSRLDANYIDRRDASFYEKGYVIRFAGAVPSKQIERGAYFQVESTNKDTNELTLRRLGGDDNATINWNPRTEAPKRPQEILSPRQTSIAHGERIRWTRPDYQLGLANGEPLVVVNTDAEHTLVKRSDGSVIQLDANKQAHQHWDHAYATTFASAQGKTATHSIVNVGSDQTASLSMKSFLVALSRHRDTTAIFVDDEKKVAENVRKHLGEKTSALEQRENTRWSQVSKEIDRMLKEGRGLLTPPTRQLER